MKTSVTTQKFIYKYFPINQYTLRTLINNELYFANPKDFNDPFDCQFIVDIPKGSDFESKMLEKANLTESQRELYEATNQRKNLSAEVTPKMQKMMMDMIGVTCFTEKPNDLLMWSHYANGHSGICLKFDWNEHKEYFQGTKVSYCKEIPFISYSTETALHSDLFDVINSKLEHWSYEQEIRAAVNITDGNRSLGFNPKALKGIVFGTHTKDEDIKLIKRIIDLHNDYPSVEFTKASMDRSKSEIRIDAL